MRQVTRLPGHLDGTDGLLELAKAFGDAQVYDLIMLCRRANGEDPGGAALTILGNRLVEKYQADNPAADETEAKQHVAKLLGYHDVGARSNFYKILTGGRRWRDTSKRYQGPAPR